MHSGWAMVGRRRARGRAQRGGASVELAVLLVLLVPALLYVTLLQDLLMAKLENLEIVTSSPWDFAPFAHRRLAGEEVSHAVQVLNRRTYLDHTSAWND